MSIKQTEKILARDWKCTLLIGGKDYISTRSEISGSQRGQIIISFYFDQKPELKVGDIDAIIECKGKSITSIDLSNKKFIKEGDHWKIEVQTKRITSTIELRKENKNSSIVSCMLFTTNFRDLKTVCETLFFQ